jgi:hypothetical protein
MFPTARFLLIMTNLDMLLFFGSVNSRKTEQQGRDLIRYDQSLFHAGVFYCIDASDGWAGSSSISGIRVLCCRFGEIFLLIGYFLPFSYFPRVS